MAPGGDHAPGPDVDRLPDRRARRSPIVILQMAHGIEQDLLEFSEVSSAHFYLTVVNIMRRRDTANGWQDRVWEQKTSGRPVCAGRPPGMNE